MDRHHLIMRLAIVTEAFFRWDGVGRSILSKAELLESAGHTVTIYMEERAYLTMPGQERRVRFVSLRELLANPGASPPKAGEQDPGTGDPGSTCAPARPAGGRASRPKAGEQGLGTAVPGSICTPARPAGGRASPSGFFDHDAYIFEYPAYCPLLEASRLLTGKWVAFDFYGLTPPEFLSTAQGQDVIRRSRVELKLLCEAHMVLLHSDASREELAAFVPVLAERVHRLPIALTPRAFEPADPLEVERLVREQRLAGRFVMLYVGRVAGNKGLPTLVEALPTIRAQVPEALLLIAGEDRKYGYDHFRTQTLRTAVELGVEAHVRFLGPVQEERLFALYHAIQVLVTASVHEGFCLPVAEAMAAGRPVVAARATALPETVGEGGLLFEPGDAAGLAGQVVRVAREPELAAALSTAARRSAQRFHPQVVGLRLAELFFELTREPPRRKESDRVTLMEIAGSLTVQYRDEMAWPVLGPILSRLRRRITLHLEKFFLRPLEENFQVFAMLATKEIKALKARVDELSRKVAELEERERRAGALEGAAARGAAAGGPDHGPPPPEEPPSSACSAADASRRTSPDGA